MLAVSRIVDKATDSQPRKEDVAMSRVSARDVVLEIIRSADGEWVGKTRLHKAFYFAHLYYAAERPRLLTSHAIARLPQGPGIQGGDELISELIRDGLLTVELTHEG